MINTWNESLLHEELKEYFCGSTGKTEVPLCGSICDIILEDGTIIEIQTGNLSQLKPKLEKLLINNKVILVYPLPTNTFIETFDIENNLISKRKSPKHLTVYAIFKELTGIYHILDNPNFTLHVLLVDILEIRIADGTGSWRRKGIRRADKKLLKINDTKIFYGLESYVQLLPSNLPENFTRKDLAQSGAGKFSGHMAWVLWKTGSIELAGKNKNAHIYRKTQGIKTKPIAEV
ncbi:MAG TPA: hypothetical protein VJ861_06785 [Treponemataceae bacterium]|nr:hypothetical protein [Treponemataceae bacterium]